MAVATALVVASSTVLVGVPAFAAPPTSAFASAGSIASGDDWTVEEVSGGYEVTKTLSEPLEIRSDVPTLWADGVDLGMATQSLDGLTLSVVTTDASVVDTTVVDQGWFGAGDPATTTDIDDSVLEDITNGLPPVSAFPATPLAGEDPSTLGTFAVERLDYNLGLEALPIRGFNRLGEERAAVFAPVGATGERPVVVFLHGRHSSCAGPGNNPASWPCGPTQTDIESYLGYNDAATILASHGYVVVSISANAINALDGSLADDTGALARGQLVMDHLSLLRAANAGEAVGLSPKLVDLLDLDNIGMMGHSRGGEGVMRAALLNYEQDEPFGIQSVLPLAPTDYTRMTVPDVATAVILPYCDGDVEDQMGQKYIDDSRHAYGDDVFRTSVLIMGTNHNYFNTAWTPGKYPVATSDDWAIMDRDQTNPVCGTSAPSRLNSDEQYNVGNAYMSAWFRLTLGDEDQFMPLFDGSDATVASAGRADVRVSAYNAPSDRVDINLFNKPDTSIQVTGAGTYQTCESMSPLSVPAVLPYCVTKLGFAQAPDYGFLSALYGNGRAIAVPSTTSVHFTYSAPANATAAAGQLRVPVPAAASDFSATESLSFRVSPDDSVPAEGSTELTVTLVDSVGGTAAVSASTFGDALTVLPGTTDPLRKVLLQQIEIPVTAFVGVDLTDVTQVRFTGSRVAGGVLLSDLVLQKETTLGSPKISTLPTVAMTDVQVEEGSGLTTVDLPVVLSKPATIASKVYVSSIASTNTKLPGNMQALEFAPGDVCKVITVPLQGDRATSTTAAASYITNTSNTQRGVTIGDSFGKVVVREDDGVVSQGTTRASNPAVGIQGDACAEALATAGALTISSSTVERGDIITVTGSGYRSGESVELLFGSTSVGRVVSAADGTVSFEVTVPAATTFGTAELRATGAGSSFASLGTISVVPLVDRIAGADRYEVAVNASKEGFPEGSDVVIIASGETFPDALSAAPAAAVLDAPILLTTSSSVPDSVKAELERLSPESILIVGGERSVTPAVEAVLAEYGEIERAAGADRYEASRAIATTAFPEGADVAVLATGTNFPDALSAGAAIGSQGPIILVNGTQGGLDAATEALLVDLGVQEVVIAGGESSVSAGIMADVAKIAEVVRLGGADRYAASVAINQHFFEAADRVLIATGLNFPDALSGSALAPKVDAPLFTVPGTCIPAATLAEITALGASQVTLLGGVNSLSVAVESLTACQAG
ncbi:cell wall-binding repeat-containing protein [Glaciihabitans tibetensis]|uniref:cell wall-binding repeat-containing protein n=1 Tax=Glaciihabitans tibetensis TaxID=1266600 RepID=UPI0015E6E319|nr:cell wall-binding repeat-containing protein [Glaciihabitans tibetensis]